MRSDIRSAKIEITSVISSSDTSVSDEIDLVHASIDIIITQTESLRQLRASQLCTRAMIWTIQDIETESLPVTTDRFRFETRFLSENGIHELRTEFHKHGTDKRQPRPLFQHSRFFFNTDPDCLLDKSDRFFFCQIFPHLQIESSSWNDHILNVKFFFFRKMIIFLP